MTPAPPDINVEIEEVRSFWDAHPCGSRTSEESDRVAYFLDIERERYARESHIPVVARFDQFAGKRVLEVGCGIGTDGIQFARRGADYVGVDLSPASVALAQEQFDLFAVDGTLTVANAEHLPFPDEHFDHVYSFGVIHHSPDVSAIVREIHRVLKPHGTVAVMVYNRSSINYRIEISILRKFLRQILRPAFVPRLLSRMTNFDRGKLDRHREFLLSKGRVSDAEWISINTDGPDCPLARVYGRSEAEQLFVDFGEVRSDVWYFNRDHWPVLGGLVPDSLARWLGRRWGWHRVTNAVKST